MTALVVAGLVWLIFGWQWMPAVASRIRVSMVVR